MSAKPFLSISLLSACLILPVGAGTINYNASDNIYYLGVEDRSGVKGVDSDYDYNDLIFTLTSNQTVTLNGASNSALFPPFSPVLPPPPPFWNNNSFDNAGPLSLNYGQCLYSAANSCTGGPFAPTASYLASNPNQNSVDFFFTPSAGSTITLNLLASIASDASDTTSLMYCPTGSTSGCQAIPFLGGVATFTPTGAFDLVLSNNGNFFDSNTTAGPNTITDSSINHFAVAFVVGEVPEPGTLAVVGASLVGLGALRRRQITKKVTAGNILER